MADMREKMTQLREKYEDIARRMETPEVYTDPALYGKLAREQKELAPVVETWKAYEASLRDGQEARELMKDPDFRSWPRRNMTGPGGRNSAWRRS